MRLVALLFSSVIGGCVGPACDAGSYRRSPSKGRISLAEGTHKPHDNPLDQPEDEEDEKPLPTPEDRVEDDTKDTVTEGGEGAVKGAAKGAAAGVMESGAMDGAVDGAKDGAIDGIEGALKEIAVREFVTIALDTDTALDWFINSTQSSDPEVRRCLATVQERRIVAAVAVPLVALGVLDVAATGGIVGSIAVAGGASEGTADAAAAGAEVVILGPTMHEALESSEETVDDTRVGREAKDEALTGSVARVDQDGTLTSTMDDMSMNAFGGGAPELVAYSSAPLCCCPPNETVKDNHSACELHRASKRTCPSDMVHLPHMCTVREMFHYRNDITVHGCQCLEFKDCRTNTPAAGHAWCKTKGSCGPRYARVGYHWDFCQHSGDALQGLSHGTNNRDALSVFVPNEHVRRHNVPGLYSLANMAPSQASTVPDYGIVLHKDSLLAPVDCIEPVAASTTGECAKLCVEHHVEMLAMESAQRLDEPCVAFAFNPARRFCVLLPKSAVGAAFHPFIPSWTDRRGWVHYTMRYHSPQACSFKVMSDLRQSTEFDLVSDPLNGHLTVKRLTCPEGSANQMATASCRPVDCDGNDFCIVQKNCQSSFGFGELFHGKCHPHHLPECQ